MLGRQYSVVHVLAGRVQPLGNANNQALAVFSSHHNARQDNMVRADTKFGDVKLLASYTVGGQASTSAISASALGVAYAKGAASVAAYVQQMNNRAGAEKRKIVGLGGNYKLSPMFIHTDGRYARPAFMGTLGSQTAFSVGLRHRF
jgi:hypothetical protein